MNLSSDNPVPTDVGDFEVVRNQSPENLAEQNTSNTDICQKNEHKPVEDALHRLISQSQIIISTIPQNYKVYLRKIYNIIQKQNFSDKEQAIREQRKNIAMMQAVCDEPLKSKDFFQCSIQKNIRKQLVYVNYLPQH